MIPYYSSRCTKFVFYNFATKWHDDDDDDDDDDDIGLR